MEEDNVVQDQPNTRFERSPQAMANASLFKQPARNYYKLLKLLTMVGEGLASTGDFIGSAARGPSKFVEKIKSETGELIDKKEDLKVSAEYIKKADEEMEKAVKQAVSKLR